MKKLALVAAAMLPLYFAAPAFAQSDEAPSTPMEQAISGLPQDKADAFRDNLQAAHEKNAKLYEQGQQLRQQMHDILTADSFDKSAFISKSKQLRNVHDKIRKNLDEAFANAVANLSSDERQKMADALGQQQEEHKAMKKGE